jgi:hypothetical protein
VTYETQEFGPGVEKSSITAVQGKKKIPWSLGTAKVAHRNVSEELRSRQPLAARHIKVKGGL